MLKLSLYDASKTLIQTYDPEDKMNVTIDTILNTGDYYLDGTRCRQQQCKRLWKPWFLQNYRRTGRAADTPGKTYRQNN